MLPSQEEVLDADALTADLDTVYPSGSARLAVQGRAGLVSLHGDPIGALGMFTLIALSSEPLVDALEPFIGDAGSVTCSLSLDLNG